MTPDAVHGLASVLEKGWGHHGYRFEAIVPVGYTGGAIGRVAHSDGSRFQIEVDRYGQEVRREQVQVLTLTPAPDPVGTIPMDDDEVTDLHLADGFCCDDEVSLGTPSGVVPDCPEFREDGTCVHSDHMMQAGLG